MGTIRLPSDFKEFLQSLNSEGVEYLVVGGHAVAFHGYPRATADLDVWVARSSENADKLERAVRGFGFDVPELDRGLFLQEDTIIRMGAPPIRIEILTSVSGVGFEECHEARQVAELEGVSVNFISLEHLKRNKRAAGRHQDLSDLDHLP